MKDTNLLQQFNDYKQSGTIVADRPEDKGGVKIQEPKENDNLLGEFNHYKDKKSGAAFIENYEPSFYESKIQPLFRNLFGKSQIERVAKDQNFVAQAKIKATEYVDKEMRKRALQISEQEGLSYTDVKNELERYRGDFESSVFDAFLPQIRDNWDDYVESEYGLYTPNRANEKMKQMAIVAGLATGVTEALSAEAIASAFPSLVKGVVGFAALKGIAGGTIYKYIYNKTHNKPYGKMIVSDIKDLPPEDASQMIKETLEIIEFIGLGAIASKGTKVAESKIRMGFEKLTKDAFIENKLPEKIYINPNKVKTIFQTGEGISPQEQDLIKEINLEGNQWRQALKQGVEIEVPSHKVVHLVDKPYWSKIKKLFRIRPYSEVRVFKEGETKFIFGKSDKTLESAVIRKEPLQFVEASAKPPEGVTPPKIKPEGAKTPIVEGEQALIQEAKGKTLEEFVGKQPKLLHGSQDEITEFKSQGGREGGVYLTTDKKMAQTFAGKEGKITEAFAKPQKIWKTKYKIGDYLGQPGQDVRLGDELVEGPQNYKWAIDDLKNKGYDAIQSSDGKQLLVLNPDIIKTKSQLTQIWEKAQETQGMARKGEKPIVSKEPVKSLQTTGQKERIKKMKEIKKKQLEIQSAEEAKQAVVKFIRERRFSLNLKNYETNLFVNSIEQVLGKSQREVIPFIIEETEIPKQLGRKDLEEIYKSQKKQLTPLAKEIKEHFEEGWNNMKKNMDNISVNEIENYVTHIWDVSAKRKPEITNWFTTQNRFLKKRFIETYKEGIEKGLKPKTLDIAEIIRIHDNIMNKVIENKKFVDNIRGLEKDGISLIARIDKAPPDWVYFDHPALREAMVIPGEVKRGEKIADDLIEILNEMGVAIGRRISPTTFGKPTQVVGLYVSKETPEIRLQRFFKNKDVTHEIGHHLDKVLKLGQKFLDTYKDELYAINRERIEKYKGISGKYGEGYVRSASEQIAELFAFVFTDTQKAYELAPNATRAVLEMLKKDKVLTKLVDFDFENRAKMLLEEHLNTMVKLPIKVHPDLANPLRVIFDSRFQHPLIQGYEAVNGILKKTKLSISLFHHTSLGETGIALTGIKDTSKIYFNMPKIYKALANNEFDIFKKEAAARKWIGRGLQVGATVDIPIHKIQEALNTFASRTKNIIGLEQVTQFVASFNENWDKALWNYLHDSLKLYSAEALGAKIDPNKTPGQIIKKEEEIAQLVNDTFGGQNWEALMVSPKTLQVATWFFLSPDWTVSTIRQALAPTGIGSIHKETIALRKEIGKMFWLKAGLYFGIGINLLNMLLRKYDQNKNPNYYKDEKMSLWDYSMMGNSIGHKTHLFVGRYRDGTERYIRWGKQFREFPELLYDDTGFSPITAILKKAGGKMSPNVQLFTMITTGHSPSGFENRDITEHEGWEKVWGMAKALIESPLPFSTRSLLEEGKEFHLTDLAMPSSKGMTRYRAIELFKTAIERKSERLFKEVYQTAIRNNLPAINLFEAANTLLKAENTKEVNSKIKSIDDVDKALLEDIDEKTKATLMRKKGRLLEEKMQIEKGGKLLNTMIKKFNFEIESD